MKIYENARRFDAHTGKPHFVKKFKEFRCDYSGGVINDDLETYSYPQYELNYVNSDPCFGSGGKEYEFGRKYDIDMFEFLGGAYHFKGENDYIDQSIPMMEHYLPERISFAEMCRASRVATAIRLIENGEITSEQLHRD